MPVKQMITLVTPASLAGGTPTNDDPPTLSSRVSFAWQPVTGATRYRYRVVREVDRVIGEDSRVVQEAAARAAAAGEGSDPACTVDLAAIDAGRYWLFVGADGADGEVGTLVRSRPFVVR